MTAAELNNLTLGLGAMGRAVIHRAIDHGLNVRRDGAVWHFKGYGVDISTTDPRSLQPFELLPATDWRRH